MHLKLPRESSFKVFNSTMHECMLICTLQYYTGLRFITDQSQSVPILGADSDQEPEEEDESYEMESMARESRFGRGWRWTTAV